LLATFLKATVHPLRNDENLVLLDDPAGRVRSHIISVVSIFGVIVAFFGITLALRGVLNPCARK
jgi:hypothetical protein